MKKVEKVDFLMNKPVLSIEKGEVDITAEAKG
jgi:hypothetical protein